MTYTEWRDELKSNLLCVSETERRRVLDYYAEAYADRREAGFSEREITEGFGAPYDAAQRILAENRETPYAEPPRRQERVAEEKTAPPPPAYVPPQHIPQPQSAPRQDIPERENKKQGGNVTFVLLCVLYVGLTVAGVIALFTAAVTLIAIPLGLVGTGVVSFAAAVSAFASGDRAYAFYISGCGLVAAGAGVALGVPLEKLTVLLCRGFNKFLGRVRSFIKGGARK